VQPKVDIRRLTVSPLGYESAKEARLAESGALLQWFRYRKTGYGRHRRFMDYFVLEGGDERQTRFTDNGSVS